MPLHNLLTPFGLDDKEQEVYLALAKLDWMTILELSQRCSIKRSTLYRVVERLTHKGLIETQLDQNTTYYRAAAVENFSALITEEKHRIKTMEDSLSSLQSQLKLLHAHAFQETSIHFYRGKRGLQILEHKLCDAPYTELRIFGSDQWRDIVGEEFSEAMRADRLNQHVRIREILNPEVDSPIPDSLEVNWTHNKAYIKECYRHRVIPKEIMTITNEITISPSAIYLYSISPEEVVGIELQAQNYAQIMGQLFEVIWQQAKAIDSFGG